MVAEAAGQSSVEHVAIYYYYDASPLIMTGSGDDDDDDNDDDDDDDSATGISAMYMYMSKILPTYLVFIAQFPNGSFDLYM